MNSVRDKVAKKVRKRNIEFSLDEFSCLGGYVFHFVNSIIGKIFAHNQHLNFLWDVHFYWVPWVENFPFLLTLDWVAVQLDFHRHHSRLSFEVDEMALIMFLEPELLLYVINFHLKGHEYFVDFLLEKGFLSCENSSLVRRFLPGPVLGFSRGF